MCSSDLRSVPWNTLALWSVRKLALTGFLCIADGLPDEPPSKDKPTATKMASNPQGDSDGDSDEDVMGPMGSDDWWMRKMTQTEDLSSVPAGVEEVTAVALLQHLHGQNEARAVLIRLPPLLEEDLSWETSWGKDERRAEWHKYKMQTKVTRPAAQLKQLFASRHNNVALGALTSRLFGQRPMPGQPDQAATTFGECGTVEIGRASCRERV